MVDNGGMGALRALVGRNSVLSALRAALQEAVGGHAGLVLVTGDAGIGKTAVVDRVAREAAGQGVSVAWGRCADGDAVPAYWPWTQVLRATGALAAGEHLGPPVGCEGDEHTEAVDKRFQLFDWVVERLGDTASEHGLMVVLDDLHWADADSVGLLEWSARQLVGRRVLVTGTYRDVEAGDRLRRVAGNAEVIRLGGLADDDVGQLMAEVAEEAVPDEVVGRMQARTGGNPLFVRELTRLLYARRTLDQPWPSAATVDSVRDAIERRLARLSQPCVGALTLAALDGTTVRPWLLGRILGHSEGLRGLLEEAVAARVLVTDGISQLRFAHDLFCEVLAADLPATVRAHAHGDLAATLQEASAEGMVVHPAELAAHFGAAAAAGDVEAVEQAVRYSGEAAAEASSRLAFEDAVAHLERALAVISVAPADPGSRLSLMLKLADARRYAGHLAAAAETYRDVVAIARRVGDPHTAARAAIGLHTVGLKTGPSTERDEHAALLAAAADDLSDNDTALAARVHAALSRTLHHSLDADHMEKATTIARQAVALARGTGDPEAYADALLSLHDANWRPGAAEQRLAVLHQVVGVNADVPSKDPHPTATLLRAQALLELGDPSSLSEIERYCSAADRRRDPASRWMALSRRAALALLTGRLADAADLIERSDALADELGDADAIWIGDIQRWELSRFTGGRGGYLRRRPDSDPPVETWAPWRALILADGGDIDGSVAALAGFTIDQAWGPGVSAGYDLWFPAIAAEAAARCGGDELRRASYDLLSTYAGTQIGCGAWVAYCGAVDYYLGLLADSLGRDTAAGHFEAATTQHLRLHAQIWADRSRNHRIKTTGPTGPNRFRKAGSAWSVIYAGSHANVVDSKGLHDIALLLGQPGQPIPATTLAGITPTTRGQPALDRQALSAYRTRLRDLDDDITEANHNNDLDLAARARLERDALVSELGRSVGRGGRPRLLNDETEKARKTVTARIHRALAQLDQHHSALAAYLRATIRTGTTCCYQPAHPVDWEL